MPWKDTTIMEQKVEFINEWLSNQYTITELCNAFEISRPTAYRLIKRYEEFGIDGLLEQSRSPINHPNKTSEVIEKAIVVFRNMHPRWGAKKIHKLLQKDFSPDRIPSVVTINNILNRNGLILPRKQMRRVEPVYPIFDPEKCNEVWSADYKGKFLMGNKKYYHPLAISDSKSRFLFTAKGHYKEQFPKKIKNWDYPPNMEPQYVTLNGAIRWKSIYWVYMARGLAGKHIGMEEIGKRIWKVFYRGVFLGYFDETKPVGYFDETKPGMKNKSIRLSTNIV